MRGMGNRSRPGPRLLKSLPRTKSNKVSFFSCLLASCYRTRPAAACLPRLLACLALLSLLFRFGLAWASYRWEAIGFKRSGLWSRAACCFVLVFRVRVFELGHIVDCGGLFAVIIAFRLRCGILFSQSAGTRGPAPRCWTSLRRDHCRQARRASVKFYLSPAR
jgi:hypothetical protein